MDLKLIYQNGTMILADTGGEITNYSTTRKKKGMLISKMES
jgi:hypothetical protein